MVNANQNCRVVECLSQFAMPPLTFNLTSFSEQRRLTGVAIVPAIHYFTVAPHLWTHSATVIHQVGIDSNQSQSESELETAKSVAQSRATALYVLCSTVGMLVCLLLAACIRRQRRRMHEGEAREAAREATRLARAELRAMNLKPKIMSFRICIDGLEDAICPICLDPLNANGQVCAGDCGHPVHETCLFQWLVKDDSMSCPVCRASFQIPTYPVPDPETFIHPPLEEGDNQNDDENGVTESPTQTVDEDAGRTDDVDIATTGHSDDESARNLTERSHSSTAGSTSDQIDNDRRCCMCSHNLNELNVRDAG